MVQRLNLSCFLVLVLSGFSGLHALCLEGNGTLNPIAGASAVWMPPSGAQLSALTCNAASVTGALTNSCKVTLSSAAPAGGLVVDLSSNSAALTVPATITVAAGATSVWFNATVSAVASGQAVTLTASSEGVSKAFDVQLNPHVPNLWVKGSGSPSLYGNTVTFTATVSQGPTGKLTFYDGGVAIGTATIVGTTGTFATTSLTVGTHVISVKWAGNSQWAAAASPPMTQGVMKSAPSISWPAPAAISYRTPLSAVQLNASSKVAGTFSYSPVAGIELKAGVHTLSVTFTPTDTAGYKVVTATVGLTVNKAAPSVSWAAPAAIIYGTSLSTTQLNATSPAAGTFQYTPAAGAVVKAGKQTLSVTFTPTDTADLTSTTTTATLTVNRATPAITWAAPAAITDGMALSTTQLNASSKVAGTFAYTPSAGTVPKAGKQTLSVTFTPTDTTDYTTATQTVTLTVNSLSGFVQEAASVTSGSTNSLSVSFPANTSAGNLILVGFDFNASTTPSSVTDSQGNTFAQVGTQLASPAGTQSVVYYAKNIKGGSDKVTVAISSKAAFIEVYLSEYAGMDLNNPIDVHAGTSGSAGKASSGNATTSSAGDVIFGYCPGDSACTAGSGFAIRSTMDGNFIEDQAAGNAGSYAATGTATGGWTMHMVALKPASSGSSVAVPAITSATTANGTVGSGFSYQIAASNTPTGFAASGLPAGLTVNTGTGLISGTPTTAGTSTVTLDATNTGGTGSANLTLTVAAAKPVLSINASSVSFGSEVLNTPATQDLTLTSSGNTAVTVNSATVTGTGFTLSTSPKLPVTLTPGQTATLGVEFDPTATGAATGQLTVVSTSSTNGTAAIPLSGTGAAASYSVDLSWNAPSGSTDPIAGYNVYRASSGSSTYQLLNAAVDIQTDYVDATVQNGQSYDYIIESVDDSGIPSAPTSPIAVTIP